MMVYLLSLEDREIEAQVLECIEYLMAERENAKLLLASLMEEEAREGGKWHVIKEKL